MAYPKRLNALNINGQEKAIKAHTKFIEVISAEIEKRGIKKVLASKKEDDIYWLRKAYDRVLNFAEQVQLKKIPTKLEGSGERGEFVVTVEIANENNPAQESGNRISQYITL